MPFFPDEQNLIDRLKGVRRNRSVFFIANLPIYYDVGSDTTLREYDGKNFLAVAAESTMLVLTLTIL